MRAFARSFITDVADAKHELGVVHVRKERTSTRESELNEPAHAFQVSFCLCKSYDDCGLLELHVVG